MRIINATKKTILADNVIMADTPKKRITGLLGHKQLQPKQAAMLKPCNSIHSFFMRFPFDAIFIDKNNKVIKVIYNFKPNRLSGIYFRAYAVIELPIGSLKASFTCEGDTLHFS